MVIRGDEQDLLTTTEFTLVIRHSAIKLETAHSLHGRIVLSIHHVEMRKLSTALVQMQLQGSNHSLNLNE